MPAAEELTTETGVSASNQGLPKFANGAGVAFDAAIGQNSPEISGIGSCQRQNRSATTGADLGHTFDGGP